jgi:hypothetical protein
MELRITKNAGKPHIILYRRNNGTETWMYADDYFVRHDLSHYALEKTLHYTTAFMGLLNNGMDIKDFENREKRKQIKLTQEGSYAENMANLFLMEIAQGNLDDFNRVSAETLKNMTREFPPPVLTETELNSVRQYLRQLLHAWQKLAAGETMHLTFEF